MPRFYLTTAIFYPNDVPHVGTAYEIIGTDALARWRRLRGDDVFFLSGNDEHALKVAQAAAERGQPPLVYCDELAAAYERAWNALGIRYDEYIRTSQERHKETVSWFLDRIRAGDAGREEPLLYKGSYEGLYCVGCEAFLREKDLVDGRCAEHPEREVQRLVEENWFFRLSAYTARLKEWFAAHPSWLTPESRRNEMTALLADGLQDISISRPRKSIPWGIPFPGDDDHVVYVWFEALINYLTGARLDDGGKARTDEPGRGPGFWPADLHVIGKGVTRFHTLIWPAMLWAADLPLPRRVSVHGYVQVAGAKMSKSGGDAVSPVDVAAEYGADTLRYFLLREVSWGSDGDFSVERLEERYATDLANTVGNLLHRTLTMTEKYFEGAVPEPSDNDYSPEGEEVHSVGALRMLTFARREQALRAYDGLDIAAALEYVVDLARQANQRIDSVAPWKLIKEPTGEGRKVVGDLLHAIAEALKNVAVLFSPVLPGKAREMWAQLGLPEDALDEVRLTHAGEGQKDVEHLDEDRFHRAFAGLDALSLGGVTVRKGEPLFPRRDGKDGRKG
jgi:methionyl-tRNA synthetase